jgi:hypothetical protein
MVQRLGEQATAGVDHSVWLCHHWRAGSQKSKSSRQSDEITGQVHMCDIELTGVTADPLHEAGGA